jgi:hypothetical protein
MDTKKQAKKYLNKYFKSQYINENDDEYKSLVRLLNKAQKQVKNCNTPAVSGSYWKILDKNGIEMPDDWAVTPRTYERVKRLLDRLNVNGEYRPYTMVQK